MNIGIIIHSHTNNTLSVAKKLQEKLLANGHSVKIDQVTAVNEEPSAAANIQLKTIPDITPYDTLIFAAPVRAFSLSPVMNLYLANLANLQGKKVDFFVTQQLPFAWMGGNRSIKRMKSICKSKGAVVSESGIINWSKKERDQQISSLVELLSNSL